MDSVGDLSRLAWTFLKSSTKNSSDLFYFSKITIMNVLLNIMSQANFTTKLLNLELIVERSGLKSGQRVADFGCGRNGHFVFMLAKLVGNHGSVYAIDIIKSHLELVAKERDLHNLSQIKTVWSNLELVGATNIEPASLDASFLINILHQTKKPLEVIKEAARISKKDAKIIIIDWSRHHSPLGPEESSRIDRNKLVDASKKNRFIFR